MFKTNPKMIRKPNGWTSPWHGRGCKNKDYQNYIAKGEWKCEPSPSGAHHWIIENAIQTCKHCLQSKILELNQRST